MFTLPSLPRHYFKWVYSNLHQADANLNDLRRYGRAVQEEWGIGGTVANTPHPFCPRYASWSLWFLPSSAHPMPCSAHSVPLLPAYLSWQTQKLSIGAPQAVAVCSDNSEMAINSMLCPRQKPVYDSGRIFHVVNPFAWQCSPVYDWSNSHMCRGEKPWRSTSRQRFIPLNRQWYVGFSLTEFCFQHVFDQLSTGHDSFKDYKLHYQWSVFSNLQVATPQGRHMLFSFGTLPP